jgi:ppGpp synthetase/RelA/SpoT-type nucleotidyltranferase
MAELSKSQIYELGERLRAGSDKEADLRLLDAYRRSFSLAFERVLQVLRKHGLAPLERRAKTNLSIVAKLRRIGMMRLSRMQDIAGCRVLVEDRLAQDRMVGILCDELPSAKCKDRRLDPSHGYRAVHIVTQIEGRAIEVQVRTTLQHLWAEFSEKASATNGTAVVF